MINDAVEILAYVSVNDFNGMDYDTLKGMKRSEEHTSEL